MQSLISKQEKKRLLGLPPLVDKKTRKLVLGSFPGPKSLEARQYYAHERNNFWRIMGAVLDVPLSDDYEGRIRTLFQHGIGLWDVIRSCSRSGSGDDRIISPIINDIPGIIRKHGKIAAIVLNGKKAEKLFKRYFGDSAGGVPAVGLPSTSPANARQTMVYKITQWKNICTPKSIICIR